MSGSTSGYTSRAPAGVARAAGGGTGTVHGSGMAPAACRPGQSEAPVPVLPLQHQGTIMAGEWPLRDFIELGALPGAVPCARLHTRQLMWEWGLARLNENAELLVSELATNAMLASRATRRISPVRLWLLANSRQVLILVWDASPQPPVRKNISGDAENGRGLLLVDAISDGWGWYFPDAGGKVVWALIGAALRPMQHSAVSEEPGKFLDDSGGGP
jgi:anti-sigma regulatory factor (Ser/Thr protein kinase)